MIPAWVNAARHELGEGAYERHLAGDCKTCGGANHISLGNTALDKPLGEFGCKCIHLERTFKVRGHGNDSAVLASGLKEPCSEAASGIYLTLVSVFLHL